MLIPVQFLAPYSIYNSNEVAGFEREVVDALIQKGVAKPLQMAPMPQIDAASLEQSVAKPTVKAVAK